MVRDANAVMLRGSWETVVFKPSSWRHPEIPPTFQMIEAQELFPRSDFCFLHKLAGIRLEIAPDHG